METHSSSSWKPKRDSVVSSMSQIQSKKAGGRWVAPWFTIPQLSVKILQVVSCMFCLRIYQFSFSLSCHRSWQWLL